jgi:hypothetical protein
MFSLSCIYGVLPLYCVFETCKVKSVLKLYFEAIEQLFYIPLYQFSQPFPEQINAKQKLFFNSKCDENSINICRDMPGAYAGLITHERRLSCLERTREQTASRTRARHYNCKFFCNCNTSLIMAAV